MGTACLSGLLGCSLGEPAWLSCPTLAEAEGEGRETHRALCEKTV